MAIRADQQGVARAAAVMACCLLTAWTGSGHADVSSRAVVVPYEDAKFTPIDPSRPEGPKIAILSGDPAKGPSSMFMKFGTLAGQMHYHTADYELVVLEGRMRHWVEGQKEPETPIVGPGSYWHQPGMQPHADSCLADVCVMFIRWSGKRDAHSVVAREAE